MVLAIIDHIEHQLFIESVDDNELQEKYNGEEEAYIIDKYEYTESDCKNGVFSWDYISQRVETFGEDKNGEIEIHRNI